MLLQQQQQQQLTRLGRSTRSSRRQQLRIHQRAAAMMPAQQPHVVAPALAPHAPHAPPPQWSRPPRPCSSGGQQRRAAAAVVVVVRAAAGGGGGGGDDSKQRRDVAVGRRTQVPSAAPSKQQQPQQSSQQLPPPPPPPPRSPKDDRPRQLAEGWALFDWRAYQVPFDVPWGGRTVAATMAAWLAAFAGTAFLVMPVVYTRAVGTPLWELPPAGQADFALWSEVAEAAVTAAILAAVVARHPPSPDARLFNYSLAEPFKRGTGWLAWGLIGAAAAPLVVGAAALALNAIGYEQATAGSHGTADGVAGMLALDGPTYARLLAVTGVLAPALEESLFRGFLLTSLTRLMPTWAAVVASAAAFGVAHLSLRDLPVLFALGCWLGAIYCRSRNLLTPMLVHGAWNSGVLTLLFWLAASGVDVQELLRKGGL